jgi:hypothetical protein
MKYIIIIEKIIPKTKDDYATREQIYSQTVEINEIEEGGSLELLVNGVIKAVNGL